MVVDPNRLAHYADLREWHIHLRCQDQRDCGRHDQLVVQDAIGRWGDMEVAEFRQRLKLEMTLIARLR